MNTWVEALFNPVQIPSPFKFSQMIAYFHLGKNVKLVDSPLCAMPPLPIPHVHVGMDPFSHETSLERDCPEGHRRVGFCFETRWLEAADKGPCLACQVVGKMGSDQKQ